MPTDERYWVSLAPSGKLRLHYTESNFVDIPATAFGVRALIDIVSHEHGKIGSAGMPTQWQLDEDLKRKIATKLDLLREELGIDFEGLF